MRAEWDLDTLNVALLSDGSYANGPGRRFVIWVQGCNLRCPGCVNAAMHPFEPRNKLTVDELAERIVSLEALEGVTFTGGEPMEQAGALASLACRLRPEGLSIMCYTGYTLEQLQEKGRPDWLRLLNNLDILVDGPFDRELAASVRWRGSRNQRIHFLTERYRHLGSTIETAPAQVELALNGKRLSATGNWPEGFIEELANLL